MFWCNPPYEPPGTIPKWIELCRRLARDFRIRTLILLPADTSTQWYFDVMVNDTTELVRYRLQFATADPNEKVTSAKFWSVLVWVATGLDRE